jgi:hypothetical protein
MSDDAPIDELATIPQILHGPAATRPIKFVFIWQEWGKDGMQVSASRLEKEEVVDILQKALEIIGE